MSTVFNDDEVHTLVVLPPDGGWGIMVVICSFICHFVIDGSIYSYGVFLQPLIEAFGVTMAQVSFVGAVLNGICYIVGPFVSACLNRYDFRMVAIMGCLVAAGAYLTSSFAVNYYMLMVGQGFLLGVGYGMLYVTALVTPSLYFAKWRSIAVALATCGTGVGTLVVPNVATLALNKIGWRTTYLCMLGIVGVGALASLAFIPLQPKKAVSTKPTTYSAKTSRMNFHADNRSCCECCSWGNKYFPTTHDVAGKDGELVAADNRDDYKRSVYRNYSVAAVGRNRLLSRVSIAPEKRCHMCWFNFLNCLCCGHCQTQVRALYRDDIFYGHSVHLIHKSNKREIQRRIKRADKDAVAATSADKDEVQDDANLTKYHMKVTRVTTANDLYDNFQPCCACHISGLRALTSMLDFRIMKSIAFLLLCFNGFFFTLGYMIPFIFVSERAQEFGISKEQSVPLISIIGGVNTIGRIISGMLPIIMNINVVWLIALAGILQGVVTACSGLLPDYWYQILFVALYGFLAGPFYALRTILVVDLFGLGNLTNIFGLQLVLSGIAGMCGPTIAGMLRDQFQDYTYSFYFSGGCLVISGLLLTIIRPVRNWEVRSGFVPF